MNHLSSELSLAKGLKNSIYELTVEWFRTHYGPLPETEAVIIGLLVGSRGTSSSFFDFRKRFSAG